MAPGTGTPEPGGLTGRELLDAVRRIGRDAPLVGMEIVEVAPPYDHADVTAMLGNRVVLETLSGIARRRLDEASGVRWDESTPLMAGRVLGNDVSAEANAAAVAESEATAEAIASPATTSGPCDSVRADTGGRARARTLEYVSIAPAPTIILDHRFAGELAEMALPWRAAAAPTRGCWC